MKIVFLRPLPGGYWTVIRTVPNVRPWRPYVGAFTAEAALESIGMIERKTIPKKPTHAALPKLRRSRVYLDRLTARRRVLRARLHCARTGVGSG